MLRTLLSLPHSLPCTILKKSSPLQILSSNDSHSLIRLSSCTLVQTKRHTKYSSAKLLETERRSNVSLASSVPLSTSSRLLHVEEDVKEKKDRIVTVPNLLCLSRIIAAPYIAHCIVNGDFLMASGLFMYAGATDFLDGWIARNFKNQASSLGSFLDPLSDKILVCTVFLSLTYANLIPASLTSLIVSRDLLLVYAGLYIRYMGVVPPFTIKKYLDPTLPTTTVQPTTISKINTALQFLLIWVTLGSPLMGLESHPYHHYLWAATGTTTFLSAVSYAFMKNTYKFSHRAYDHQFGKKLTAFVVFIVFNILFTYSFPVQVKVDKVGSEAECPLTGGPDPYNQRTNEYYLKQIRNKAQ